MSKNDIPEPGIKGWLNGCRSFLSTQNPGLLPMFDLYSSEARNGYLFLIKDLESLPKNSTLLEIGAGPMLLSSFLQQEGYQVQALEPSGIGFSHFGQLRELVLLYASQHHGHPTIIPLPAEQLEGKEMVDFAFSINVMEHVTDVALVLRRVLNTLRPGATYHFTCPNALFPYEPHFNIPTLFSKDLTERLFSTKIHSHQGLNDPSGVWGSLNWIGIPQLRRMLQLLENSEFTLNKQYMVHLLLRSLSDREFAARRSPLLIYFIALLVRLKIHLLVPLLPAAFLPIIDCTLLRRATPTLEED